MLCLGCGGMGDAMGRVGGLFGADRGRPGQRCCDLMWEEGPVLGRAWFGLVWFGWCQVGCGYGVGSCVLVRDDGRSFSLCSSSQVRYLTEPAQVAQVPYTKVLGCRPIVKKKKRGE